MNKIQKAKKGVVLLELQKKYIQGNKEKIIKKEVLLVVRIMMMKCNSLYQNINSNLLKQMSLLNSHLNICFH